MARVVLVVCSLLVAGPPGDGTPSPDDIKTYESARAKAGRDADAHVRLALWCEAHGMSAERARHLALAVLADPGHAAARGLMGLVRDADAWRRPEQVAERARADAALAARLAEYNAKRAKAANTADAQWELALWCERAGLKAEATAHLTAVTRLDPKREAAWKRLGFKRHDGRWMADEQVAAAKAEAEAQAKANKRWVPLLEKWRGGLTDKSKRAEAEAALAGVDDPRAVPSICKVLGLGGPSDQVRAVQLLGQIDARAASRALAVLAVLGKSAEVRRSATETLKRRDPREWTDLLIAWMRDPIKYEVKPVGGPGSPGALFVAGRRFNVQRLYSPPPAPVVPLMPGDRVTFEDQGLPVLHRYGLDIPLTTRIPGDQLLRQIAASDQARAVALRQAASNPMLGDGSRLLVQGLASLPGATLGDRLAAEIARASQAEHKSPSQIGYGITAVPDYGIHVGRMAAAAQDAAIGAQRQLAQDVAAIESFNAEARAINREIAQVLTDATGQAPGDDREAWRAWWIDQLGYNSTTAQPPPVPTIVQDVPLAYQPAPIVPVVRTVSLGFQRLSCFGAGTLVRTFSGPRPIEEVRVGDRVLTQDTATGALSYEPVVAVHHNPPSQTLRIRLGDEAVVSSTFHRFWRAGRGWAMARELKPGDTVRTLDGLAKVISVEPDRVQPVYNLDVAVHRDFFVGHGGALVHDNSLPGPRDAVFDAAPSLAQADARAE
jgi:hypothetical protein